MPQSNETQALSPRQQELFARKSTRVSASYLRRVEAFPNTPKEMMPFFQVLEDIYVNLKDVSHPKETKTIGTYCVMVPNELIYAAGAMPVRLCTGSYTAYSIGDDYVPRDACPLVKAVIGFEQTHAMPLYENVSLMVIPVTCDCKKKLAGMLEDLKPTEVLHIPLSKETDGDTEQYTKELYRLIPVLEQVTGQNITAKNLAESINQTGYAQYEISRFLHYRMQEPALLYGTQVMAVMNAYAFMRPVEWADRLRLLNAELESRLKHQIFAGRTKQPRILVTGSPITFPNLKIPLLIEEMGGMLVADETCLGERALYDPAVVTDRSFDGMMRALAARYTRPCTCPVFSDNRQRIYRIRQMIKTHKVQGVIYHVLRGCLVYDYEYRILEEELEQLGIPVIRVESDYNEEDVEQIRIRIEAFIELIKLKEYSGKIKGSEKL